MIVLILFICACVALYAFMKKPILIGSYLLISAFVGILAAWINATYAIWYSELLWYHYMWTFMFIDGLTGGAWGGRSLMTSLRIWQGEEFLRKKKEEEAGERGETWGEFYADLKATETWKIEDHPVLGRVFVYGMGIAGICLLLAFA